MDTDLKDALNESDLVNWERVAKYIGLRERAFWKLVHDKGLPRIEINKRVIRFSWAEVNQWLEKHRIPLRKTKK